jgi:TraE protein
MIQRVHQKWFEVWGNEVAQNQILKYLLLLSTALNAASVICILFLALRTPPIFAVSSVESGILKANTVPKEFLESEAKRVIGLYLQSRHNWDSNTITQSIGTAAQYVDEAFRKTYLQANETQIRIAKEKRISQKFYTNEIKVDLAQGKATVRGDRIISVDGLRAVSPLAFNLDFRMGKRIEANPEGVYIISEQLIDTGKEQR